MGLTENSSPTTKSIRVSRELTRDIFSGLYKPGQPLVRRQLVQRYGVSLSIVNESLARLASEGLVEIPTRASARVVALEADESRGNFLLREAVECQVARLLAVEASEETLSHLLGDARALDQWIMDVGAESGMHLEFHLKLARATGHECLEQTLKRSGVRQLLTSKWLKNQEIPHPPDFHESLVRSFFERDASLAEDTMRKHLHYGEAERHAGGENDSSE